MSKHQPQVCVRYEPGAFAEQLGAGVGSGNQLLSLEWNVDRRERQGSWGPANCH